MSDYDDSLLFSHMAEDAEAERLADWAKEYVDELDLHAVVDELASRTCVITLLERISGIDAEVFDNDAHKFAEHMASTMAYKLGQLSEALVEYKFSEGYPDVR